ncbi:MAG: hypothetical protein LBK23_12435, partial [Oscillospiraceae bacterium]|nr:hypothetical protein [Oscillospiraceae bacterium]
MLKSTKFADLLDAPFSRRGSFIAFANDNYGEDLYGKCTLWLCNSRIAMTGVMDFSQNNGFRQIKLQPVRNGKILPCVISTTPYEVILETRYGSLRFTIGERKLVLVRGENGLSLRLTRAPGPISFLSNPEPPTPLAEAKYTTLDFSVSKLLVTPITGTLKQSNMYAELSPDKNGILQAALEDVFVGEPKPRETSAYPTYDDAVADVKADFDGFCERVCPSLPKEFEPGRLPALWQTWSMTVEPDGESAYKRTMVKM